MKRSRIIVRELTKTFRDDGRDVAAVQGASFEIHDGEFVAIVGPSGCGKSTILNMIGGLVTPTAGRVEAPRCNCRRMCGPTLPPPMVTRT